MHPKTKKGILIFAQSQLLQASLHMMLLISPNLYISFPFYFIFSFQMFFTLLPEASEL
jgi:hypothetical protein